VSTELLGIGQSDVIIRAAIIEGIADMRRNPDLLDKVFASLKYDDLTKDELGESEIAQAKKWFLASDIPVFLSYKIDESKLPCISISLEDSAETEYTLGDVHYVPFEDADGDTPILAGPFAAKYVASSGFVIIPFDALNGITLGSGMVIVDRVGREHTIIEVLDDNIVAIAPNTVADFSKALLKSIIPRQVAEVRSVNARETYHLGCHVQGEPFYLTWLHSIMVFVLLRYKVTLLEARGYERSTLQSTDFTRNMDFATELAFSRWINITGYLRQYWPQEQVDKIETTDTTTLASLGELTFSEVLQAAEDDNP
jgi:hypothetical protein